jgi:putative PIN family toxin of toxin-antitoxin system
MRIVIDTNILVSALWQKDGNPASVIEKVLAGELEPAYDDRMMAEYREVLTRSKFSFDNQRVDNLLAAIKLHGIRVQPKPSAIELPDEDDRPFLEVSWAAGAKIVTGNTRHFPEGSSVTPAELISLYSQ